MSTFDEVNHFLTDDDSEISSDKENFNKEKVKNPHTCTFNPCIFLQLPLIKCGNPECSSDLSEKFLHHACQISYQDTHDLECKGCKKWCCNCVLAYPSNREKSQKITNNNDIDDSCENNFQDSNNN